MSGLPGIRIHAESGRLLMRDGLSITFYLSHSHAQVSSAIGASLEVYVGAIGARTMHLYASDEGEWCVLDDVAWESHKRRLLGTRLVNIHLRDADYRFGFEYHGHALEELHPRERSGAVCAVSFLLSSEYLEEQGPEQVQALALKLAEPLPFSSGHAGLSFNGETEPLSLSGENGSLCFRHPGFDIPQLEWMSWRLGTRVRGAHWLTFLGPPVLDELGGVVGLRARLSSPQTVVRDMAEGRAVVRLGVSPEAGDIERGETLPAYRELARVLEPWTYHEEHIARPEELARKRRRWEQRFLD